MHSTPDSSPAWLTGAEPAEALDAGVRAGTAAAARYGARPVP